MIGMWRRPTWDLKASSTCAEASGSCERTSLHVPRGLSGVVFLSGPTLWSNKVGSAEVLDVKAQWARLPPARSIHQGASVQRSQ